MSGTALRSFYSLAGPTRWAGPPERFSYSSLRVMEECPLRWQLMQSEYGDLPRCPERPRPAALVGRLAHELLEQILRAMARAGYPAEGSDGFRSVVAEIGLMARITAGLRETRERLRSHPRATGDEMLISEREIYNRVCRLFQGVYGSLSRSRGNVGAAVRGHADDSTSMDGNALMAILRSRGVLTELRLAHDELPLQGVLDLVLWDDGVGIVDFKTGEAAPGHRQQLEIYALLWFRETRVAPRWIEVRYPGDVQRFVVDEETLVSREDRLRKQVAVLRAELSRTPAEARLGPGCRHCEARAFCGVYWRHQVAPTQRPTESPWIDVELTVVEVLSETGFTAQDESGGRISVVFSGEVGRRWGPFSDGERLRVVAGSYETTAQILQLQRATEVFRVAVSNLG